jgi:hypothetical protein
MKYFLITAILFAASPAIASDAQTKQHQKELARLQPKLSACIAAISNAQRHGNVWQDDNLSLQDCKDAAMKQIDLGTKLINDGLRVCPERLCGIA